MRLPALLAAAALVAACEFAPAYPTAELVISPEGKFTVDGRQVAEQDLAKDLQAIRERNPDALLVIRRDRAQGHPNEAIVSKAVEEAAFRSVTHTGYREHERAYWLGDILFFGGSMLFCVLVVTPFALRAKDAEQARRTALTGIFWLACAIGVAIGAYMDYKSSSKGNGIWLVSLFMLFYFVPLSLVTGVITGSICSRIVRRRTQAAASQS